MTIFRSTQLLLIACALIGTSFTISARPHRTAMLPNGNYVPPGASTSCQICHIFLTGGDRNAFGLDVEQFVTPNGSEDFWPSVFNLDSDGDGASNGLELGDPTGTGVAQRITGLSAPGDPNSLPVLPNQAPSITSTAPTGGTIGTAYQYQVAASDPEGGLLIFSLISPPAWLSISASGLVSGIPPDNQAGGHTVKVQVFDNGAPPEFSLQTYSLIIVASFDGWKNLHFSLPAEDALAAPGADPDNDGIPNLHEYATRLNPRGHDEFTASPLSFVGNGQVTFTLDVRDDDPALVTQSELSTTLPFTAITTLTPSESDPTPGDGMKRLTFTDSASNEMARFIRLKITR
ncbi:MAG: putative Ig domain-containing protein [Verrucomicrobiia bacterium]